MYSVLLIGIGNIGNRYFEGIICSNLFATVYLYDKSVANVENAISKNQSLIDSNKKQKVKKCGSIDMIPSVIDIAIVTTTADVRFSVISSILFDREVKYILLEKVIFQKNEEYELFYDYIHNRNITCWVNHPRRLYPYYRMLKDDIISEQITEVSINGGDWGLGCNGLHYIDLIMYLFGKTDIEISCAMLDPIIHESKREGFVEFSGSLLGEIGKCKVIISSLKDSKTPIVIIIHTNKRVILISEKAGVVFTLFVDQNEEKSSLNKVKILYYQSELIGKVLIDILNSGKSDLPKYDEVVKAHQEFIMKLLAFYNKTSGNNSNILSIT